MKQTEDQGWMQAACMAALDSVDPSTQNGAVVVSKYGGMIGSGFNNFPIGIASTPERWNDRKTKYGLVIHAEEAAIINAIRTGHNVVGGTLYCPWAACRECAKKIIAHGISRVVIHTGCELAQDAHWREEREAGLAMLHEAGVQVSSTSVIDGPVIRRNGAPWQS